MGADSRNSQAMTADVAIIGAGIVGSSTALELSRRGLDVLVVDKAGGAGMGSTSASSAIIRFNYSTFAGVAVSWESKFRSFYPPKRVDSEEFFDDPRGDLRAIFTPDGGYVDDPRLAAANLAAAAAHRGARFAYRRLVTSISRAGQVWRVEIEGDERVEAPWQDHRRRRARRAWME